jgi:UDP-N-acetylmuramate dehydrogenase
VVIYTGSMQEITLSDNRITAAAGVPLQKLCHVAAEHGLSGLEFAFGIPGSVGGGVYMNAGAYGGELQQVLTRVDYLTEDGDTCSTVKADCGFGYRDSRFQHHKELVVGAEFTLTPDDPAQIRARMRDYIDRRRSKQPLSYPSAGSTFKRPQGAFAGGLIEQCGLKGFSVGGAQVSTLHAGFVINTGNASCEDVCQLVAKVQQIVKTQTGFDLEPEVQLLGRSWKKVSSDE